MRNHNVAPWADLSTMRPMTITALLTRATRATVIEMHDRAFWKSVGDVDRAARATAMSEFWDELAYGAMFTIEDRLERAG